MLGNRLNESPAALRLARRFFGPATVGLCLPLPSGLRHFRPIGRPAFFRRSWVYRETPGLRLTLALALAGQDETFRLPSLPWLRWLQGLQGLQGLPVALSCGWLLLGLGVWLAGAAAG